jgi:hypothetical protein
MPSYPAANKKGNRRTSYIPDERDKKTPPEAKEKTRANAQDAAGQEEHVAAGV